jgi:hypothetical protein
MIFRKLKKATSQMIIASVSGVEEVGEAEDPMISLLEIGEELAMAEVGSSIII